MLINRQRRAPDVIEDIEHKPAAATSPEPAGSSEQFGRLHPSSLFFDLFSHIRSLIIPAVIAVLSAASGSRTGLVIAAVVFCTDSRAIGDSLFQSEIQDPQPGTGRHRRNFFPTDPDCTRRSHSEYRFDSEYFSSTFEGG